MAKKRSSKKIRTGVIRKYRSRDYAIDCYENSRRTDSLHASSRPQAEKLKKLCEAGKL